MSHVGPIQPRRKIIGAKIEEDNQDDVKLEDPTSVSLMNSFLIKNAAASFEGLNLKMMKKKPNLNHSATMNHSSMNAGTSNNSPGKRGERNTYGKV